MNRHFIALRGLAVVLVILNHAITLTSVTLSTYGYPQPFEFERYLLTALQQLGLIAVPTFLFLSGSYIVYAVQGRRLLPAYKTVGLSLRYVFWPYILWSIVFYVVIYLLQHDRFTLFEYAKNLAVGYPFNFVPLLVVYYLAGPFLVYLGRRQPWLLLIAIAAYQLFLINVITPGTLGFTFPSWARWLTPPVIRGTLAVWGIHFPLGVVYGIHASAILPRLRRIGACLAAAAVGLYGLHVWALIQGRSAPLTEAIYPIPVVLLFPLLRREAIPLVKKLELYGRKSYGLYLTHLIIQSCALAAIRAFAPWLFEDLYLLLLVAALFGIALVIPLGLMVAFDRLPNRMVQRYVFG